MRARTRRRLRWLASGTALAAMAAGVLYVVSVDAHIAGPHRGTIDAYPVGTTPTACAGAKPGVVEFRRMILSQLGGVDDGLSVCKHIEGSPRLSDHSDGRAWDWGMDAMSSDDRAKVDLVATWLTRPDRRGYKNAMARRLGITYMIWNRQIYEFTGDGAGWGRYTGTSNPHTDHVHFSFSVAGANERTSWWTERGMPLWYLSDDRGSSTHTVTPFGYGVGASIPVVGDWNGDGRDTVGSYNPRDRRFSLRNTASSGAADITTPPIGRFGAIPYAGDWNGDGRDEIGVYDPSAGQFFFYDTAGVVMAPTVTFGRSDDLPIIGDWDNDRVDDVGLYRPSEQTFYRRMKNGSVVTRTFGILGDTPVAGDWNGDGYGDLGLFRSSTHTFYFVTPRAGADPGADREVVTSVNYGAYDDIPLIGDWDGSGSDSQGVARPDAPAASLVREGGSAAPEGDALPRSR